MFNNFAYTSETFNSMFQACFCNKLFYFSVNEFQQQCDEYLVIIVTQKREADEQQSLVAARSVKIAEEEVACKKLADIAQADLMEAMPALEAAMKVVLNS